MKNDEILHKWVNGTLSPDELVEFKNRPEYESLKDLYQHTANLSPPKIDEETMLSEILKTEKAKSPVKQEGRSVFLSNWIKYGVAASLLLAALWFFLKPNNPIVRYQIAKAEQKQGVLPDGSTFVLNAESSLSYNTEKWNDNRSLELDGEAFFSVQEGSRFRVETPNGIVQVLGTKFNVRSRDASLEVRCKSGKVAVLTSNGDLLKELKQRDMVRVANDKIIEDWENTPTTLNWTDGVFKFKASPLSTVLAELERQFDVHFDTNSVDVTSIISCNFQNKNLKLALKTTLDPLNIQYKIVDKKVILSK